MYITPRYDNLNKWYRENLVPGNIDKLEKAETKWLAEKTEIESSEKDFNTYETHWEDEYYSYLSNSENEEGQPEYFEGYHKAEKQLKEIGEKMEVKKSPPPPLHLEETSNPSTRLCPEVVPMQLDGQTDISVEESAIKTSPEQKPSGLYPKVVIKTQPDGQAKEKDILTEISPNEGRIRDSELIIKSLPQIDGPTDPSSDDESTEEKSPITKGKMNQVERRKLIKSPKTKDITLATVKGNKNNQNLPPPVVLEGMPVTWEL
ncbi:hypothetical protein JTB14_036297 [Gonioctena quinquepunctata]|nr:hypothetical protein JTB14_036297 [Gonioctena quinquepunctata]